MGLRIVLLQFVTAAFLLAQSTTQQWNKAETELIDLCPAEKAADAEEAEALSGYTSSELQTALQSEEAWWNFLINPATRYLDRMAAASKGGNMVSAENLPRLWQTYAKLQIPVGVYPSPCTFLMSANLSPRMWAERKWSPIGVTPAEVSVLGVVVHLPKIPVDYPVDLSARGAAPWLWQMERAFSVLFPVVMNSYKDPDRYRAMSDVAFRWTPADYSEGTVREEALSMGPHNALRVENLLRLALESGDENARRNAIPSLDPGLDPSDHVQELTQTALILILLHSKDSDAAASAALALSRLSIPVSPTALLAIARFAADSEPQPLNRYYVAVQLCRLVGATPFKFDQQLDSQSPEISAALARFDDWLAAKKPLWQEQSEKERQHLASLAAELHQQFPR